MGTAATAYAHLGRVAGVAAVLNVDPLDRHLTPPRLLEDDLRAVVQIVATTARAARARIAGPANLAGRARQLDPTVLERSAGEVVVSTARRADDLEGHGSRVGVSDPTGALFVAVSTAMSNSIATAARSATPS